MEVELTEDEITWIMECMYDDLNTNRDRKWENFILSDLQVYALLEKLKGYKED